MQMSLKSVLDFVELQKAIFVSAAAVIGAIGAIGSTIMWRVNEKKAKAEERLLIDKALDEEKLVKVPVAPPPKSFTPFARLICTNQPC
jgi:hypothetical protein